MSSTFTPSQVAAAVRFNKTTLRKLSLIEPQLKLDADSCEGHRRYSRADVVRVALVSTLMNDFRIPLSSAIPATNAVHDIVEKFVTAFATAGGYDDDSLGPILSFSSVGEGVYSHRLAVHESLAAFADDFSGAALVVHLRQLTGKTLRALGRGY